MDNAVRSFRRDAWVIPNGHGQLWTDQIFSTEAEAITYLDTRWIRGSPPSHVKPVLARVQVFAALIAAEDRHG